MWTVIAHSQDCQDGKCPTISRHSETGRIRVRGHVPGSRGIERDVEFSAEEWAFLAAQLPK